jgi:hypothetical protein
MPIDRTLVNQVIDRQIEAIEAQRGEDVEIANVCFVVAIKRENNSEVRARASGDPYMAVGMLRTAEQGLLRLGVTEANEAPPAP